MRLNGTTITGKYNAYTMEVVQQIGSDSFDPGHGVIINKVKNSSSSCGGSSCFAWMIDSHPDDIDHVDFVKPDGTPKIATQGDERQLNDGSFNAGLDSGSTYEWTDERNRLHFYVVDKTTDAQGILHYKVAVKSLDGAGPQTRGVALQSGGSTEVAAGQWSTCTFGLKNTGAAAATDPALHPQDSRRVPDTATSTASRPRPRAPAGAPRSSTRSPPSSSATRSRSRSTSRRPPTPPRPARSP